MAGGRAGLSVPELLEKLGGNFRGLLDAKSVPEAVQAELARKEVDSSEMYAVIADDRGGVRTFVKDVLGIDPAADPARSIDVARLVVCWEAAKQRLQISASQEAKANADNEPKAIPVNDYLAVKKRFENQFYTLREEEVPSRNSLEDLADQLETGDWRSMSLKEVASKGDVDSDSQWGSLTVGKLGQVKLKKSAVETPAPKDLEEFRQKLKLLGHHFVFLRMLHPTRKELGDVTPFTYSSCGDYMLKRVARLQSDDEAGQVFHTPTLKQVLTYDFYVRKKAMELLTVDMPLQKALQAATECATTRERHFTTPFRPVLQGQGRHLEWKIAFSKESIKEKEKESPRRATVQFIIAPHQKGGRSATPTILSLRGVMDPVVGQDLSDPVKVGSLVERVRAGEFDAVFMSPPCNTWSRAVHSNKWGPRPLRNKQWPLGFPWLTGKFKDQAKLGNLLVEVCIRICQEISELKHLFVLVVWEHPEDLGAGFDDAGRPIFPASVWQLPEVQCLWNLPNWFTIAFFQCEFKVDRLKPTRLLSNVAALASWGSFGPPTFDESGFYTGPLPQTCPHGGHPHQIVQR